MKNVSVVICMLILLITNGCRLGVDKKVDLPVFDFGVTIGKSVPDTFIWNNIAKRISYVPIEMTNDVWARGLSVSMEAVSEADPV